MQVHGSDNAGPGSDILVPELMSEGIETLLEKKKAYGTMLGSNFILSEFFTSECTLSLIGERGVILMGLLKMTVCCNFLTNRVNVPIKGDIHGGSMRMTVCSHSQRNRAGCFLSLYK